jgi:hypothetical protein
MHIGFKKEGKAWFMEPFHTFPPNTHKPSRGHDRQSSEQNNRMLISLFNNGEDDKHAHGFADF